MKKKPPGYQKKRSEKKKLSDDKKLAELLARLEKTGEVDFVYFTDEETGESIAPPSYPY
jgi:translation elongation factor EF-G